MLLAQTIQTLFPVFAVIGLGYLLTRKAFLGSGFLEQLNWLVYWVSLPALIVSSLDRAQGLSGESLPIILVYFAATFCVIGLSILAARFLKLQRWQYGTFIQGSFRGNLAFIGIPILLYALRDIGEDERNAILAQAVFVFAPIMILYNVASVIALVGGRDGASWKTLPGTLRSVAMNPLILAALAGLVLYLLPVDLPMALGDTLQFIGRIAAPAALICVGGGMALTSMEGRYRSASWMACLKVFVTPAAAYLASLPFALSEESLLILMVFAATPTAVVSFIMAKQLNGDEAMASGAIVLSTILSIISLSAVVMAF
jgi:predicted permease